MASPAGASAAGSGGAPNDHVWGATSTPMLRICVAVGALTERHQVDDRSGRLAAEVGEDVAHVDVEVDDGDVLAGDLRDRRREVGRQERLARPALGREHRDDVAAADTSLPSTCEAEVADRRFAAQATARSTASRSSSVPWVMSTTSRIPARMAAGRSPFQVWSRTRTIAVPGESARRTRPGRARPAPSPRATARGRRSARTR